MGATVTSLDSAMCLVLRKGSVEGARSNQLSQSSFGLTVDIQPMKVFFTAEFIIRSTRYPR